MGLQYNARSMPDNLLTLVAEIVAQPGKEDELRNVLLGLIEPTHKEAGCIQYDLHEDNERSGHFIFFERWTSQDHLDRHLATPHLEAFKARMDDLLAEPLRLVLLTKLG